MYADFENLDLDRLLQRRSEKWRARPPDVLPAFVAEMDYPLAAPVREALHAAIDRDDCGYANGTGLASAFVEFCAERTGWHVAESRVFMVPDVMAGVVAVLELLTAPGDRVVINPPVYPPFFDSINRCGRRVVEVPMTPPGGSAGRWSLDLAGLEAAFAAGARAYLLCNPHNPTGRVFSAAELRQIADLADQYGVLVLADEIHSPLTLPGATHTPFVSLGDLHAVTLTSATKAFNVAGLKCAVMVAGSEQVRQRLLGLPGAATFGSGLLGIIASEAAWRSGGPWLDAVIGQLDRMRGVFGKLLAERLPGAVYLPPEASYLGWVDCSALGVDAPGFLSRGKVAVADGNDFGAPGAGFVRVTLGTSTAILTDIVDRMARAV